MAKAMAEERARLIAEERRRRAEMMKKEAI
jgi:hypothetical protein